jgi:Zn-finger nucleic acid-binding protein
MDLTCPKCHGPMRTYERNGVHVDQCAECRGIFLDRGELDRLIDAENAWHGGRESGERRDSAPDQRRESSPQQGHGDRSAGGLGAVVGEVLKQVGGQKHSGHGQSGHGYPKRKKESFLGDLFG